MKSKMKSKVLFISLIYKLNGKKKNMCSLLCDNSYAIKQL